jgi:hypothetical protein
MASFYEMVEKGKQAACQLAVPRGCLSGRRVRAHLKNPDFQDVQPLRHKWYRSSYPALLCSNALMHFVSLLLLLAVAAHAPAY